MRPSTSGRATFIAMSRAVRPWAPFAQDSADAPDKTTWKIGASLAQWAARGFCVAVSLALGELTAKLVQLSMTVGGASMKRVSRVATDTGSFRLATKIGSGFRPARRSDFVRRLMGCRPAPWTRAR